MKLFIAWTIILIPALILTISIVFLAVGKLLRWREWWEEFTISCVILFLVGLFVWALNFVINH
jgi:hypothetical protein